MGKGVPPIIPRIRPPGHLGMQIFGGRTETQMTSGSANLTWEFVMELMARSPKSIGRVNPIIGSGYGSTPYQPIYSTSIKALAALTDLPTFASPVVATYADGQDVLQRAISPSTDFRRTHIFSDAMAITPVDRSDGGTRPLIAARCWLNDTTVKLLGKSGDTFSGWASRSAGLVRMQVNSSPGDQRGATTSWGAANTSPVVGFAYSHLTPIYAGMIIGDSIDEGRGTLINESFGLLACEAINAGSPRTWQCFSNLAWVGKAMSTIAQDLKDILSSGIIPDWILIPAGSPNDFASTLSDSVVDGWRQNLAYMLGMCATEGITPIVRNVIPVNYAVRAMGSTDAKRIAYNAEIAALCAATGVAYLDAASIVAGSVEAHGQLELNGSYTADGIHPNSAGNALIATSGLVPILRQLMRGYL